jgi:hypothetical protein
MSKNILERILWDDGYLTIVYYSDLLNRSFHPSHFEKLRLHWIALPIYRLICALRPYSSLSAFVLFYQSF